MKKRGMKKYSLNDRIDYHQKIKSAYNKGGNKVSTDKGTYSSGFLAGVFNRELSSVEKCDSGIKKGYQAGVKANDRSKNLKY